MEQNRNISCEANEAGLNVNEEEAVCKSDTKQVQSDHEVQPRFDMEAQNDKELSRNIERENDNETSCKKESETSARTEPHLDEEAGFANTPHHDKEAHYDRGWAWVVCGTAALMEFFVGGMITSSGVIYAALIEEFNKSRAETGKI